MRQLVDTNIDQLTNWLNAVAEGIPNIDPATGGKRMGYLIRPNPARAFTLLCALLEFHVPKVARVDIGA